MHVKNAEPRKSAPTPHQQLAFDSTLERIADGMEYYALSVPASTSAALHARAAVPVLARVNGSEAFKGSLYPVGGGRHYLRVRNKVCKSVGINAGDRVRAEIVVRDRQDEIKVPTDLKSALKGAGLVAAFAALPIGKKSFLLRLIDEAVKPETRARRIRDAVDEARAKQTMQRG